MRHMYNTEDVIVGIYVGATTGSEFQVVAKRILTASAISLVHNVDELERDKPISQQLICAYILIAS